MQLSLRLFASLIVMLLGFGANAQFTVGGDAASLGGGCYRLTAATNSQAGYVYQNAAIDLNDTIDWKFRVNLGTQNAGADGIIFVLRDTLISPFIGQNGGFIGFNASSLDTGSLGVEIDTYQNTGYGDPVADHIGIQKNGSVDHNGANALAGPVQALAGNVNIEDGAYHTLQIKWNPSTEVFKVYVDCTERLSYTGDLINDVFDGDALVYWGFLGTTGGANNLQRFCFATPIDSVTTALPPFVDICKGDTAFLSAGTSDASYTWTPGVSINSVTVHNPKVYPLDTTMYYVRRTYQCDTNFDSVLIRVIPPNFNTIATITDALCKNSCDGEIDLSIIGGTGSYTYSWSTNATTQDVNGLCDGEYFVTIQDTASASPNYLCFRIDTFDVDEPELLEASIINETKTKCPKSTNCDAEARAVADGGTPPYYYSWTSGETVQQAMQLCAGWNWVTITDANGCTAIDSVEIEVPDTIVTEGFGDTLICINNVAAIVAASSGGTPPYSFIWHEGGLNGPVISIMAADAVTPDVTTTYFVESYDANGCYGDTSKVTVKVRPPLDVEFISPDTICPYDTVDITAVGIGGDSIYSFNWAAGGFGPTLTVSPDQTTWYAVTITDFCGTPFAVDSVKMQVGGYDDLEAHIRLEDDSICAGKSIYMIASGTGGYKGPEEYRYTWQHNQSHDNVQFIRPLKTTKYVVLIEDLCLSKPDYDTITVYVGDTVNPVLDFDPPVACDETDVIVSIDNYNYRYTYDWAIDTIDAFIDYRYDSIRYNFDDPGCYDFDLFVTTDFGCKTSAHYDCGVRILKDPRADFEFFPEYPTNVEPILNFKDATRDGTPHFWIIENDTFWDQSAIQYEFYEREEPFQIMLFSESDNGCLDSTSVKVKYLEETIIYIPNSFSPDGNNENDFFFIESEGVRLKDFNLEIYNRWGEQVFRTTRQTQGWDGKTPTGDYVGIGTYFYVLTYRDHRNIERILSGEIFIVKTGHPTGL